MFLRVCQARSLSFHFPWENSDSMILPWGLAWRFHFEFILTFSHLPCRSFLFVRYCCCRYCCCCLLCRSLIFTLVFTQCVENMANDLNGSELDLLSCPLIKIIIISKTQPIERAQQTHLDYYTFSHGALYCLLHSTSFSRIITPLAFSCARGLIEEEKRKP